MFGLQNNTRTNFQGFSTPAQESPETEDSGFSKIFEAFSKTFTPSYAKLSSSDKTGMFKDVFDFCAADLSQFDASKEVQDGINAAMPTITKLFGAPLTKLPKAVEEITQAPLINCLKITFACIKESFCSIVNECASEINYHPLDCFLSSPTLSKIQDAAAICMLTTTLTDSKCATLAMGYALGH